MLVVFYTIIAISLFALLSYYLIFISLNRNATASKKAYEIKGISIVICAKNEYNNLKEYLPYFLSQDYEKFEVIVVNDDSTDKTAQLLDDFSEKYTKLRVLHLNYNEKILKGKRHALLKGIQVAKFPFVALSDADCKPLSDFWLKNINKAFVNGIDIVLGYGPYEKQQGFLNLIIQFETTLTALMYLSFAKIGHPYMGVGRNIAYRKSMLNEKIFNQSNKTQSGDDDLIFSEIAHSTNCAVIIDKNSFVQSKAPSTWKAWIHQKTRHYSTAKHYKVKNIALVGAFNAFNLFFYCAIMGLILMGTPPFLIILLYLSKSSLFVILNYRIIKRLNNSIFFTIWIIDFIYFLLLLSLHIKTLFSKSQWQEAKI